MKLTLCFFFLTLIPCFGFGSTTIFPTNETPRSIFSLKPSEIRKITGVKMTWKEKIAWSILKKKLKSKKFQKETRAPNSKLALIFGIIAISTFWIPIINFFTLPLAIAAIIIGSKAKRLDPADTRARTAVTLGIITLAIIVVLGVMALLLFSNSSFFSFG